MIPEALTSLTAALTSEFAKDALARAIQRYKANADLKLRHKWRDDYIGAGHVGLDISERSEIESAIGATHSTREVITTQLTILEKERNRLIPIATREHWVALIFVVIAGIVFFTSIGLFVFATLAKGVPTLLASMIPGFLGKTFFKREADIEKRLKEISSDLRASEKVKERLEIIEEALDVIPEEYRERVLEDFTKTKLSKP